MRSRWEAEGGRDQTGESVQEKNGRTGATSEGKFPPEKSIWKAGPRSPAGEEKAGRSGSPVPRFPGTNPGRAWARQSPRARPQVGQRQRANMQPERKASAVNPARPSGKGTAG